MIHMVITTIRMIQTREFLVEIATTTLITITMFVIATTPDKISTYTLLATIVSIMASDMVAEVFAIAVLGVGIKNQTTTS